MERFVMLIKTIITLLGLFDGQPSDNFNQYDLARLHLSGLIDSDNVITPEGRVIVLEVVTYLERVL
jgi:hypothetical protein